MCTSSASSAPGRSRAYGPIATVRADLRALDDARTASIARARADRRVAEHAVRADRHAVAERHRAFEHAARRRSSRRARRPACRARRCAPGRPASRPRSSSASATLRWCRRSSSASCALAVDAERSHSSSGCARRPPTPVRQRARDDVGQVVLALRVVVPERASHVRQLRGRRGHDAGVDLADRALARRRVLLLDDLPHRAARIAHDAAVAGRVVELTVSTP